MKQSMQARVNLTTRKTDFSTEKEFNGDERALPEQLNQVAQSLPWNYVALQCKLDGSLGKLQEWDRKPLTKSIWKRETENLTVESESIRCSVKIECNSWLCSDPPSFGFVDWIRDETLNNMFSCVQNTKYLKVLKPQQSGCAWIEFSYRKLPCPLPRVQRLDNNIKIRHR